MRRCCAASWISPSRAAATNGPTAPVSDGTTVRGLVVASFIVEQPMPLEMGLLAADLDNARVALDHG
jgi:hypothetical protein